MKKYISMSDELELFTCFSRIGNSKAVLNDSETKYEQYDVRVKKLLITLDVFHEFIVSIRSLVCVLHQEYIFLLGMRRVILNILCEG